MIPTLTLKSGSKIPRIGIGTWGIGGFMTRDPKNDDKIQIEAIQYALERGIPFIRTAQNYAEGHCEKIIGQAIKDHKRENIYLMTSIFEGNGVDEQSIIRELNNSLKRLHADYVDIVIIGGIEPTVSISKIAKGLSGVLKQKLAKEVGVGNYRLKELMELNDQMDGQLTYNEMQYNLIVREPLLSGTYDYQKTNNIIMGAYRPLQLGQLAQPGVDILDNFAIKYQKSPAQISLKWILSQDNTVVFPKTINKDHIDQLIDIVNWEMTQEDLLDLTDHFPVQMRTGDCIPPIRSFIK